MTGRTTGSVPSRHPEGSLGRLVDEAAALLAAAGVDTARLDARVLASHHLGRDPAFVLTHPETPLDERDRRAIEALIARRAAREPVSRIVGRKEFWSLDFTVDPATLTPRPDTEILVEGVLAWLDCANRRGENLTLLDLGTGTGCILLALLSELPNAHGTGIDVSAAARDVAAGNAARLGLDGRAVFRVGDWFEGVTGRFDVIVSNPPYIAEGERPGLAPEVAEFEPSRALFAGPDGLDAYRAIAAGAAALLAPDGGLFVEIGAGQAADVRALFEAWGFRLAGSHDDLAGITRCLFLVFPDGEKRVGIRGWGG